jgi:dinuclear metal center YbgI/SA1388 family protein
MITVAAVAAALAELAPPALAESWDNVGLLAGDPAAAAQRVLAAHDLSPAVLDEAAAWDAQVVVCFHPPLFRPLARVTAERPESALIWRAVREGRALYATHTALDNARPGTNDFLAAALAVTVEGPLRPAAEPGELKLVVFTPPAVTAAVAAAAAAAGAGGIGEYAECSVRAAGIGSFRGSAASHPAVGQAGRREEVAEERLELRLPRAALAAVTAAVRAAHPYEEPAIDVYALEPEGPSRVGAGRLGSLAAAESLAQFARRVAAALAPEHLRVVGAWARPVRRVALVGGSGASFIPEAARAGAEVLVTGDVKHHDALLAQRLGLALVDPGHWASERLVSRETAAWLGRRLPELDVRETGVDGEPFARRLAG